MSEKTAATLQRQYFEQGDRMAREAEAGGMHNVNRELAEFRNAKGVTPEKYNALIKSIQSANTAHVAQDQYDLQGKQVKKLTVPTLILADSEADADKLPDHIAGYILGGKKVEAEEPKLAKPQPQKTLKDGDYPLPWSEKMADKAWRDVLYPGKK